MDWIVFRRRSWGWIVLSAGLVVATLLAVSREPSAAVEPQARPPADQTYVGAKECGTCHFDQLTQWRTTSHSKAFDALPPEHRSEQSCQKCHATGVGKPTGFKSLEVTPDLASVSCESCHGPGSEHVEAARSLANQRLSPEDKAYIKSLVHAMPPTNVCVECHIAQRHGAHPSADE